MLDKLLNEVDRLISLGTDTNKYLLIKKIISEKNAFMKMDISVAYSILKDLNINNIDEAYEELTILN